MFLLLITSRIAIRLFSFNKSKILLFIKKLAFDGFYPDNHYCVPDMMNFPAVDSIIALRNPFCHPENNNLCLVCFQMVADKNKHLTVEGGRRIRSAFKE